MEYLHLALLAGLCLLGGCFFLLRFRRRGGLHPAVRDLLGQAVLQRSVMLVELADHGAANGRFFGPCAEFDEKTMLIDLSLRKEISEGMHEAVLVSFKIDNKGASSYYQFTSHLRGLLRRVGGFGILLDTPAAIIPNQKRSFVRLSSLKEATFGVGIWQLDPDRGHPDDPASMGAAQLVYRHDHLEHMSLLNVSAGGLCLELKRPQENRPSIDPQPGDRLLCLLVLRAQEKEQLLSFWLDCTVMNRGTEEDGSLAVGLHFNAWAIPQRSKGAVDWFAVGEGGAVGPLAAWVLRQQLAQLGRKKAH